MTITDDNSGSDGTDSGGQRRIWRFGDAVFDEGSWSLAVAGRAVAVESKPLTLLRTLLDRPGEAFTKTELLETVWPGVIVVEASLTTAVMKLRSALGDADRQIVQAVPRVGYRLGVPVKIDTLTGEARSGLELAPGDGVPSRPQWRLEERLGPPNANRVWRARHFKTGELRVFKFAEGAEGLNALKREAAILRVLRRSLGEDDRFVRLLEWSFDTPPFFIETSYGGLDLDSWMKAAGGAAAIGLPDRLAMVANIARIVAATHGVGVLHKDIKPRNILIMGDPPQPKIIRLVDFGSGGLADQGLLKRLDITGIGLAAAGTPSDDSGTLPYAAPELLQGAPPTTATDVYALGVLLYQMVVGDLSRPLSVGWEAGIADPLLIEDIAASAEGAAERRTLTAAQLAENLDTLDTRRAARAAEEAARRRTAALAEATERARVRRPWLIAAAASLVLGIAGTTIASIRAVQERDEARRQTAIAQAVNLFLTDDLLGRGDPAHADEAKETLMDAATRAEEFVDARFAEQPAIAASIHSALARAFDQRSEWNAARAAYDKADAAFAKAEGPNSIDARMQRLRRASMEALSFEKDSVERAKAIIAEVEPHLDDFGPRKAEAEVWIATTRGMIGLAGNDARDSLKQYRLAADLADTMPDRFTARQRLNIRQRFAFTYVRLGDGATAEPLLRDLLDRQIALQGPNHPDALILRMNLGQAYMVEHKDAQAVQEFDRAYPDFISRFGPEHRLTLQLLAARQQSLGSLERYDESIRDGMAIYKAASAQQGPHAFRTIAALADIATAQCRAGRLAEGIASARTAFEDSKTAFGSGNPLTGATSVNLAFCMAVAKRYDSIEPLLEGIDAKAVADLVADPDWGASIDLIRADMALNAGDIGAARGFLDYPGKAYERPDADPYLRRWTEELLAATGGSGK